MSSNLGFSTPSSFWATTPITLDPLFASLINLIDLSRPAVIGITTPGKSTVFRNGKIANESGNNSFFITSSSSVVIKGISSEFSSKSCNDKLSSILNFFLLITKTSHYVMYDTNISQLIIE